MSAPVSRDPLVVNTQDGSCWVRRALTSDGHGLYALEGTPRCCPEYVLTTLSELAEVGLRSMTDALPMPVGPEPSEREAAKARVRAKVEARKAAPARERIYHLLCATYTHAEAEAMLSEVDGSAEVGRLRTRVAELEAERHSTNEALDDAVTALRADRDRIAELEALTPAPIQTCRVCGSGYSYGQPCSTCEFRMRVAAEVDGITRRIAPTQALGEDESGACPECGDGPSKWCVGCAKCSCVAEHDPGCAGGAS